MASGDRVRDAVATRTIENSLQALLASRFRAETQMVAALTDHPVDRTRVDEAFAFVLTDTTR